MATYPSSVRDSGLVQLHCLLEFRSISRFLFFQRTESSQYLIFLTDYFAFFDSREKSELSDSVYKLSSQGCGRHPKLPLSVLNVV